MFDEKREKEYPYTLQFVDTIVKAGMKLVEVITSLQLFSCILVTWRPLLRREQNLVKEKNSK